MRTGRGKKLPTATVAGACKSAAAARASLFHFVYLHLRIHARNLCKYSRRIYGNSGPDRVTRRRPLPISAPSLDDPFSRSLGRRR